MDNEDSKIIPINRAFIGRLTKILTILGDNSWNGPKEFNAIFVDRKGFMKQALLPSPPPPYYRFAVTPKVEIFVGNPLESMNNYVEFAFFQRVGETLHYREV